MKDTDYPMRERQLGGCSEGLWCGFSIAFKFISLGVLITCAVDRHAGTPPPTWGAYLFGGMYCACEVYQVLSARSTAKRDCLSELEKRLGKPR